MTSVSIMATLRLAADFWWLLWVGTKESTIHLANVCQPVTSNGSPSRWVQPYLQSVGWARQKM